MGKALCGEVEVLPRDFGVASFRGALGATGAGLGTDLAGVLGGVIVLAGKVAGAGDTVVVDGVEGVPRTCPVEAVADGRAGCFCGLLTCGVAGVGVIPGVVLPVSGLSALAMPVPGVSGFGVPIVAGLTGVCGAVAPIGFCGVRVPNRLGAAGLGAVAG